MWTASRIRFAFYQNNSTLRGFASAFYYDKVCCRLITGGSSGLGKLALASQRIADYPSGAAGLGLTMKLLWLDRVIKIISRHRMIRGGDPGIAAVSGGADSVCLVHALRGACVGVVGLANGNQELRGMVDE
jgi:hypothetical protein